MDDEVDWETVIRRDGPGAWRAAYRIVGHVEDAADCVQEALLAAIRIARAEPLRHIGALLVRLAAARAIDKLRRVERGRTRPHELESLPHPATDPAADLAGRELLDELRQAIASLPAQQAQVFVLSCVEDWPRDQVARELSMTPGAVAMTLLRARQQLRAQLADRWTHPRKR